MKNIFDNHERTSNQVKITVDRFYVDGVHVCMSWYGGEDHDRMACPFLLSPTFGNKSACGFTGIALIEQPDVINPAPDWCPLKG